MAHAWLDSLSEDWESQLGSDSSRSLPTHETTKPSRTSSTAPSSRTGSGRLIGSARNGQAPSANSSNILSERSVNEINIFGSRRSPSKLSNEYKISAAEPVSSHGRPSHRSVSASSLGSVVHHTVDHKPHSASPGKAKGDTPEWRRRLVHGDIAYGEQRDLFTSARTGLEDMFHPPPADLRALPSAVIPEEAEDAEDSQEYDDMPQPNRGGVSATDNNDMTLPSSPPTCSLPCDSSNLRDDSMTQQLPEQFARRRSLEPVEDESAVASDEKYDNVNDSNDSNDSGDGSVRRRSPGPPNETGSLSHDGSQIHYPMERESRITSGQSVLRNESFSAILISPEKDKGVDGAVFGPVELPPGELKKRLENLRWKQMVMTDNIDQDSGSRSASIGGKSLNVDSTEEYEKKGGFINFRRGGRSADGSFRNRPLSPPLSTDTSDMLPEESLQASTPKQFASVRTNTDTTSHRQPNPVPETTGTLSRQRKPPGGSPLKLFGPYDTFTNQTLMRRISQYEDSMSSGSRVSADRSAHLGADAPSNAVMEDTSATQLRRTAAETSFPGQSRQSSAQFGAGELDGYQFADELSHVRQADNEDVGRDKRDVRLPPLSDEKHEDLHIQRMRESRGPTSSRPGTSDRRADPVDHAMSAGKIPQLATPRRVAEIGSEGKRPRTSPSKDPTPKRRRTLHKSDVAFGAEAAHASQTPVDSVQASHLSMQSIIGRKRRDALDGDELQNTDAEILASRNILRPRTPTPSQRSSVQRETNPDFDASENVYGHTDSRIHSQSKLSEGDSLTSDGRHGGASMSQSDSPFSEPLGPATGPATDGERKPSIRTEDFLKEACETMEMLRRAGQRAMGGLSSVEESEMETPVVSEPSEESDLSYESTKEPFSRPPSREGKPVPRVARRQEDPELAARLRKYEERSDLDDLVTTTTRSIHLAQNAIRAEKEVAQAVHATLGTFRSRTRLDDSGDISDPPNLRISTNPERPAGDAFGLPDDNPSQASQKSTSSGPSTSRSIPTGSSRGSGTRKTIPAERVAHLIPAELGNMFLDRDRNIWIERRSGSGGTAPTASVQSTHHMLPSQASEDDPLADITDLSVDESLELRCLKPAVQSRVKSAAGPALIVPSGGLRSEPLPAMEPSAMAEGGDANDKDEGSEGDENEKDETDEKDENDTAVEHEISINEDRVAPSSSPSRKRHLAISFSSPIASIIQDFVAEGDSDAKLEQNGGGVSPLPTSAASTQRGRRTVSVQFRSAAGQANIVNGSGSGSTSSSTRSRSASRGPPRKLSVAGRAFVPRPVSRIDEREEDDTHHHGRSGAWSTSRELSVLEDRSTAATTTARGHGSDLDDMSALASPLSETQQQANLSVVVTTPGPARRDDDEQVMAQYVGMLSLSPMSEFTMHQERSLALEASYVLGDRHLVTGDGSKAVMSQSLRDLVDRLAEVEPHEPYWEDLEELDVGGRWLASLHKLDTLCPQLVTLNAADNALGNVGGVPATVRHLRLANNRLSELTSWTRLANLQYLDISNNTAVHTLSGLRGLVHLRTLRADNCGLTSLDGLQAHDGLQTLRARGNGIERVDFGGTRLRKLVELDLEGNAVTHMAHVDELVALTTLNLRRNRLEQFGVEGDEGGEGGEGGEDGESGEDGEDKVHGLEHGEAVTLPQLRTLHVSDNRLTTLDVRGLPALRTLFADRNRLERVRGLSRTPRLDSLSLRAQELAADTRLDVASLYHAYEVRKLYLSGNVLDTFDPPVDFLNLQLLELANCGLTTLPATLGRALPNLRTVNVNLNALVDLAALRGIPRLKKLLAAGNRLAHAHAVVRVLAPLAHLAEVDLRDNPVTQGFYARGVSAVSASSGPSGPSEPSASSPPGDPFALPPADAAQDAAYCRRLDLVTGMRRRVYSQVLGEACAKLQRLDGLAVDRSLRDLRDAVWEGLRARGIVDGRAGDGDGSSKTEAAADESRWGAEDTFA